jgi:repressor LexA
VLLKNRAGRITPRQLAVLRLIAQFEGSQCYSPTIAELADELDVSRTTVFEHITELRKKELLTSSTGRARSSTLTQKANRLLNAERSVRESAAAGEEVPLLGRVAAGVPIEAIEDRQSLSLRTLYGNTDDIFALEVDGDSMIDEGINTGDYVICQHASTAENGQMVIAIVDDENATLKRFYREGDCVRLEASNPAYEPIYTNNCRVQAIVVGHIRRV